MCSEYSFLSQEHIVIDLSVKNPRFPNALSSFPPSSSGSDRQPYHRRSTLNLEYDNEDQDMTDEEQERSLIQPLIDAHHRGSIENRRWGFAAAATTTATASPERRSVQIRTHRPQHSQTVTILDDENGEAVASPYVNKQLTMSQFDFQQARNHHHRAKLRQQALASQNATSNNTHSILDKVCKWSRYSQRSQKAPKKLPKKTRSLKRTTSLSRHKDFSNKQEIDAFAKSGNFIFHRGFSLRRSQRIHPGYKLRSRAELASAMNYIDPENTPSADFTAASHILAMRLRSPAYLQLVRLHPKLVASSELLRTQSRSHARKNSIRRLPAIPRRKVTLRKSKSLSSSRKLLIAQHPQLYDVWRRYMTEVVRQRIILRLQFMRDSGSSIYSEVTVSDMSSIRDQSSSVAYHADAANSCQSCISEKILDAWPRGDAVSSYMAIFTN